MAYVRKRETGQLDKFDNPVLSYQVVWREPVRDEFGAPTGKLKQTSETFDTERKAKAHLRKVETDLESAKGIDPSSQKAKANTPLGVYGKQYLDSLVGTIDDSTIEGYAKIYRTHLGPVFGSRPVASITTADVTAFRAALLAPHKRHQGTQTVTRSPKTAKHIVGTLKRILDTAQDDQAIPSNPVVAGRRHTTKRRATSDGKQPFKHRPLTANQVASVCDWIAHRAKSPLPIAARRARTPGKATMSTRWLCCSRRTPAFGPASCRVCRCRTSRCSDIPGTVGSYPRCAYRQAQRPQVDTWHTQE